MKKDGIPNWMESFINTIRRNVRLFTRKVTSPVLETMHYRSYGESQNYMRLPEIFMPTEFLHGLYDGGHGAGLYDYWK